VASLPTLESENPILGRQDRHGTSPCRRGDRKCLPYNIAASIASDLDYSIHVDWSSAKSLSEKEQMRLWVENWKRVGPELERIKRQELRALSEEEAFDQAEALNRSVAEDVWVHPRRLAAAGLVEQQRLFQKLRQ
jgi:hypothetical protein